MIDIISKGFTGELGGAGHASRFSRRSGGGEGDVDQVVRGFRCAEVRPRFLRDQPDTWAARQHWPTGLGNCRSDRVECPGVWVGDSDRRRADLKGGPQFLPGADACDEDAFLRAGEGQRKEGSVRAEAPRRTDVAERYGVEIDPAPPIRRCSEVKAPPRTPQCPSVGLGGFRVGDAGEE